MTDQTSAVYDPVVKMTSHSVNMDRLLAPKKPFGTVIISLADQRAIFDAALEPVTFTQKKERPHMRFVDAQAPHNRRH